MLSTSLIIFEVSFVNSSDTYLFNVSLKSLIEFNSFLSSRPELEIKGFRELHKPKMIFKKATKQRVLSCVDHLTELHLKLEKL